MPISACLALLLAAGIAAGLGLDPGASRLLAALAIGLSGGAIVARMRGAGALRQAFLASTLLTLAALHGLHAAHRAEHPPLREWFDTRLAHDAGQEPGRRLEAPTRLRGRLRRDASPGADGVRLHLAVTDVWAGRAWAARPGEVALTVGGTLGGARVAEWRAGRSLELSALLRRPAEYRNPGAGNGERMMAWRGTALVGSVKSAALVELDGPGRWWDEQAAAIREAVRRAMARRVGRHAATSAAVGTAILIGDRASLTPDLERRLQEAGTYHVVAISGGNIAILAAAVVGILWMARVRFAGAAVTTIVVLVAHAWVIGGGASVVRATVMAVIYLALRLIDQRTAPVNAVAVGAALMLVADPLQIVDAGFWLTFGATGGLLAAGARLRRPAQPRWWHAPAAVCLGTLAVECVLAPVSALVFERVTLAGLGLNLVAVPAMALVQGAASVCVLADAAGLAEVADLAGWVTHLASSALVDSSRLVDLVPWAVWRVPPPARTIVGAYYLALAVWWGASSPPVDRLWRRRLATGALASAAALWVWITVSPATLRAPADGRLHVTALDVGQGEAVLVTCPDGTTLLVDAGGVPAGGSFDVGDRVVGPALRARGVRRLDYLAITHADADHVGGAPSVLRDFRPREVWVGVPVPANGAEGVLRDAGARIRAGWRWLQRGDRMAFGSVELRVHHPPLPGWERQRVRNDDSLVLELRLGEMSVLLTGDITSMVEEGLADLVDRDRTVVLKVPHHGSATSSAPRLLDRLAPAAAIVSAGRDNLFGHPAPAVVARYRARRTALFRTDQDGQIEIRTDGRSLEVTTFTGRRWRLR